MCMKGEEEEIGRKVGKVFSIRGKRSGETGVHKTLLKRLHRFFRGEKNDRVRFADKLIEDQGGVLVAVRACALSYKSSRPSAHFSTVKNFHCSHFCHFPFTRVLRKSGALRDA